MWGALAVVVYCLLAVAIAAVGGGWIGLGRVDPALIIPGLGWATVIAAWLSPPSNWAAATLRAGVLVAVSILAVVIFAGAVWPWQQWLLLFVVGLILNFAVCGVARAAATWPARRWLLGIGGVLAALAVQHGSWRVLPWFYAEPVRQDRITLDVLSGVPLTRDHTQFAASLRGATSREPFLERLEQTTKIHLIDSVRETPGQDKVLLLIHPRALEPQQLVAIDNYVRQGGRAIILADGLSNWPQPYALGDPRNPALTSLLTPLLTHWGLALDAPEGLEARRVEINEAGQRLRFLSPGHFRVAQPPCVVSPDAIIARCALGQGKVVLVADADWLGEPQWRGPSGSGPVHISSGNIEWLIAQVDGLAGHVPTRPAIFRPVWTH